jgi:hypothetical protein
MIHDAGCKQQLSRLQIGAVLDLTAEPAADDFDLGDRHVSNLNSVGPKLFAPEFPVTRED